MIFAIFLSVIVIYGILILLLAFRLGRSSAESSKGKGEISITMVVACRNESRNLPQLLDSIDSQTVQPDRIVFVDDHSTDNTGEILTRFATGNHKTVTEILQAEGYGKKAAIIQALSTVESDYIFFTDADCVLSPDHIRTKAEFLSLHPETDMLLGGVEITADKTLFNKLERLEFAALQAVTAASTLSGHPIMCNGANLTVKTDTYRRYVQEIRTDIASGDDMFMLHAMKAGHQNIDFITGRETRVSTKGTGSLSKFRKQRIRWAGKTPFYTDRLTILTAGLVALSNMILLIQPIVNLTEGAVLFAIKSAADFIILFNYLRNNKTANQGLGLLWFFPLAAVIYPFYCVIVGSISILRTKCSRNR